MFYIVLPFFPVNLGAVSDEVDEWFHQDINTLENGIEISSISMCWQITPGCSSRIRLTFMNEKDLSWVYYI